MVHRPRREDCPPPNRLTEFLILLDRFRDIAKGHESYELSLSFLRADHRRQRPLRGASTACTATAKQRSRCCTSGDRSSSICSPASRPAACARKRGHRRRRRDPLPAAAPSAEKKVTVPLGVSTLGRTRAVGSERPAACRGRRARPLAARRHDNSLAVQRLRSLRSGPRTWRCAFRRANKPCTKWSRSVTAVGSFCMKRST